MPVILKDKRQFLISKVRSILAEDHQIALDDLAERLEREHNLTFERHYLSGIVSKIYRERALRADRQTLNQALAAFEDSMTQVVRVAWEIANDPFARKQDRVAALREIREAHNVVFEKLFDAGVFERKLGTLDATIHNAPLPEERKKVIHQTFENWGLLRPHRRMLSNGIAGCPFLTNGVAVRGAHDVPEFALLTSANGSDFSNCSTCTTFTSLRPAGDVTSSVAESAS